jgi:hypothetical protein
MSVVRSHIFNKFDMEMVQCDFHNNKVHISYIPIYNTTETGMNDSFYLDKESIQSYISEYMQDDEIELLRELSSSPVIRETGIITDSNNHRLSMISKIQRWIRECYARKPYS